MSQIAKYSATGGALGGPCFQHGCNIVADKILTRAGRLVRSVPNISTDRTGSDFLTDGGVTSAYWYGELAPT